MSLDRVWMLVFAAALMSGCHMFGKSDCHSQQEYQRAAQAPPLLTKPTSRSALMAAITAVARGTVHESGTYVLHLADDVSSREDQAK